MISFVCLSILLVLGLFSFHNAFRVHLDLWPWDLVIGLPFPLVLGSIFMIGMLLGGFLVFYYGIKNKLKKNGVQEKKVEIY